MAERRWRWLGVLWLLALALPALAEIRVLDDTGQTVVLPAPARRVISLAPHVTETLFAIGAGDRLVGAVDFSDYPPAAKRLPRVGGYSRLDTERILALQPDLVVGWAGGNDADSLAMLRRLGLTLFLSEPQRLEDMPDQFLRLGRLLGQEAAAGRLAEDFRRRLEELRRRYAGSSPVRVFYQVWDRPLITLNGEQPVSDLIRLCAGHNVFADLTAAAPRVDIEAVLAADPQVIIASGMGAQRPEWLDAWRRWPELSAVRGGHLYVIDPDIIQRPGPRLLQGAERMCELLERVRAGR
ncbi:cobalamin-binding protein [Thiohalobacter sp. IOR34]|uniref:cobalamin-binding protein n=1 Tax=Thiohalobacter sp. IOR34 TaxID=3057176 RepID=UPI0025B242C4|nr:cobalamin-binding protein [Thiohalobacter sp. IOR34]WJW75154.1 cobalamin-binding protein [Thiohalobacter sp. IOR34]